MCEQAEREFLEVWPDLIILSSGGLLWIWEGRVTGVDLRTEPPMCTLVVTGRGLKPGTRFTVFRERQFVARVEVEEVQGDHALCRILFTREGDEVRTDDLATTR